MIDVARRLDVAAQQRRGPLERAGLDRIEDREMLAHGDLSVTIKSGVQFGLFGGAVTNLGTVQVTALGQLTTSQQKRIPLLLDYLADHMPVDKPRYLMGVGTPADLARLATSSNARCFFSSNASPTSLFAAAMARDAT